MSGPWSSRVLKSHSWHALLAGTVACVVAVALFITLANTLYLGWHDFYFYMTKMRTWLSFTNTLWTSLLSAFLSLLLAVPAGYALSRHRFPFADAVQTILFLPVLISPCAVGVFLLACCRAIPVQPLTEALGLRLDHALPGVILAQCTVICSFGILLSKTAFDGVAGKFEHVSHSLGAGEAGTFFRVVLPMAKNGLFASFVLMWARAAAEWESLMIFVGAIQGRTDVLPLAVYLDFTSGRLGFALSMSLLCLLLAMTGMVAVRLLGGRHHVWS
ncbi:ABC transporter permease subunit [candidate division FCPU426 bacterium]|nr:ABC transporter permease subunit [candidate division FCPU426 bacterium]